MSESKRKNFIGDFKTKVALEALRSFKTVNEIVVYEELLTIFAVGSAYPYVSRHAFLREA